MRKICPGNSGDNIIDSLWVVKIGFGFRGYRKFLEAMKYVLPRRGATVNGEYVAILNHLGIIR